MKIMGIDYGDARTGIAISDLLCSIVGSTCVIPSRNRDKTLAQIKELCESNGVTEIVLGLPKNMDGSEGPRAQLCKEFAEVLRECEKHGLKYVLIEEEYPEDFEQYIV